MNFRTEREVAMIGFGNEQDTMDSAPFLINTTEGQDNDISFIISFPLKGEKTIIDETGIPVLNEILGNCIPIYPDGNNTYEIIFENYVIHMTRNESYTIWDDYEIRHGKYLILFERSRLLDSMPKFVECELIKAVCSNAYKHYGIYCQNHIIDIITTNEPIIRHIANRNGESNGQFN